MARSAGTGHGSRWRLRRRAGWLVTLALVATPPAGVRAGAPTYSAEVDVALATRQLRILDERQCVARQVRPGDVQMSAGGRPLTTLLRRCPPGPIRVLVVIDASFSMVGKRLELATLAARRLLERLGREGRGDEAAVSVFDEGVYWLTPEGFTSDLCGAALGLGDIEAGGGTALWSALASALEVAGRTPSSRTTAIVVVTDGQDTTDRSGEHSARVRRRARDLGVPIFAIAIPPRSEVLLLDEGLHASSEVECSRPDWHPRGLDRERERLHKACMMTGGAMYTPRKARVLEAVDFVLTQIRDVHEAEAYVPAELSGPGFPVGVTATRPGYRILTDTASRD